MCLHSYSCLLFPCPIYEEVQRLLTVFNQISFACVSGELDTEADSLLKEGLQLAAGTCAWKKAKDGTIVLENLFAVC